MLNLVRFVVELGNFNQSTRLLYSLLLSDMDSIKNKNVMIVFGQRNYIALSRNLESTTTRNFDMRALKLRHEVSCIGDQKLIG